MSLIPTHILQNMSSFPRLDPLQWQLYKPLNLEGEIMEEFLS